MSQNLTSNYSQIQTILEPTLELKIIWSLDLNLSHPHLNLWALVATNRTAILATGISPTTPIPFGDKEVGRNLTEINRQLAKN
jgi:hypothetical protein